MVEGLLEEKGGDEIMEMNEMATAVIAIYVAIRDAIVLWRKWRRSQ